MNFSDLMWAHRSIRSYKPDPIEPTIVEKVLADAVAGASSSGNLNSVTMILTRDPEKKKELWKLHSEQDMILEAPLLVTFCADWYRTREWLRLRGAKDNFNNFLGYQVASFDAMILAQNVSLGFESHGMGICYMGTTLFSMKAISELLNLPETCAPVTTIVVGYPAESPNKRDRLPMKALVFEEEYVYPNSSDIDAIFGEREIKGWERYMSMPGLKALAEERGITSLAQFYTSEIKYDPKFFTECSKEIEDFLVDKGFIVRP